MDTTKLTTTDLKLLRRRIYLKPPRRLASRELNKFDRYYFGFINHQGEEWVYVVFDPHKIKYFNAGGERHIANLSPMVYNIATKKLYLAGWSGTWRVEARATNNSLYAIVAVGIALNRISLMSFRNSSRQQNNEYHYYITPSLLGTIQSTRPLTKPLQQTYNDLS